MAKIEAVTNMKDLREQLEKNCLFGDAMLTLKWLLDQYDALVETTNWQTRDFD